MLWFQELETKSTIVADGTLHYVEEGLVQS